MKLLLGSCGLSTEPIMKACEEMVGKSRQEMSIAIINEAIKGEIGDQRWFVEELEHLTEMIGGNLEFVDLQSHSMQHVRERIDVADAIYCFGGNTDYLANVFAKTGFEQILPTILEKKVWVGSSAGSCVLCHKEPEQIQQKVFKEKRAADRFMGIVPIVFLPHFHGSYNFDQPEVIAASKLVDLPVYAMSDHSALRIEDVNNFSIVGEDYIVAQNGEIKYQ